jgi:sugar phosphate isomerase/epimerase
MFRNLSPGAIGIRANLEESLQLAKAHGFQGIDLAVGEAAKIAEEKGIDHVRRLFDAAGQKPGGWGLPVNWRAEEEGFRASLADLPRYARTGKALGCTRVVQWIPPTSDELPFKENFDWHVARFRPIAEVLKEHGCSLGLEFIGPKTLRAKAKHEFIWTMGGMLELCEAIGTGNVGLLLDCWHWYTSHGTLDELKKLKPEQVVYVHVNDAPAGVPIDEQVDNVRCLPAETGVIPIAPFLRVLHEIGYDGPVTPEPFSKQVNAMPPQEAAATTGEALLKAWRAAGLTG